jgi:nucleotide-binding universal stress UspA family protein
MMDRFLVVVDDSAAALRAAEVATGLAAAIGARLTLVTVLEDHVLDATLRAADVPEAAERRAKGAVAMLTRVAARAAHRDVRTETEILSGHGAEQVLAVARRCGADLIVVAREPHQQAAGRTAVNVELLLEFTELPVLVVPPAPHR